MGQVRDFTQILHEFPSALQMHECVAVAAAEPADPDMIEQALRPWTGDCDAMVERRLIRALVPYNLTIYFVDEHDRQRGASCDALAELERVINEQVGDKTRPVRIPIIPVARDQVFYIPSRFSSTFV